MSKISMYLWSGLFILLLAGCITVELKDERAIPTLFEIALVTHTPPPGATQPPEPTALPPSPSPVVPTETATPQPVPSETPLPSQTPTLAATQPVEGVIFLNAACRQGPGLVYPVVAYLSPGETAQVDAQNSDASWWLVQVSNEIPACWVSGQVIHLNTTTASRLPVVSAPPTPFTVQQMAVSPSPTSRSHPPKGSGPTDTSVPPTSVPPTSEPTATSKPPYPYP